MFCFTATTRQGPSQFEETGSSVEVLELDHDVEAACLFVRETARDVGFKFPPEEIIPGILFCAAERVLLEVQDLSVIWLEITCIFCGFGSNFCPSSILFLSSL